MLLVVGVACVLGWLAGLERSRREVEGPRPRWLARLAALKDANAPLMPVGTAGSADWAWAGYNFLHVDLCKTPRGRLISLALEVRSTPLGLSGLVRFAAGARSVTWPIADLDRGRTIDLKAEFPEAFR